MALSTDQIVAQSKVAFKQWGKQWEDHCIQHKERHPVDIKKNMNGLANSGVGKAVLLIANGYSFEKEIATIKEHQKNVDLVVCDKTLGSALDQGLNPKYCIVCDANVSYEKYMEPWKDKLSKITLLQNVCGNPKWANEGNWKSKYFFVNKDSINSEETWGPLTQCPNVIPAGTNVSNAMVIMMTQSDNFGRKNFFGYDKILLIGFDYCWESGKKYYAFSEDGGGKNFYMRHQYIKTIAGQYCFSSNNLIFSAHWLKKYIDSFKLPVIQCSKDSILATDKIGVLSEQMQYSFMKEDAGLVQALVEKQFKLKEALKDTNKVLARISRDHHFASLGV